jgi:hypothetical protein
MEKPELTAEELAFFDGRMDALPLYLAFRERVLDRVATEIRVKRTQISFYHGYLFAAVSFTPVRRAKDRPKPWLTVTLGLPYRVEDPRIDAAVEPYPGRWTHHLTVGTAEELDQWLMGWVEEAAAFAERKR